MLPRGRSVLFTIYGEQEPCRFRSSSGCRAARDASSYIDAHRGAAQSWESRSLSQADQLPPAGYWQSTELTKASRPCAHTFLSSEFYKKDERVCFAESRGEPGRTAEADTTILPTPCLLSEAFASSSMHGVRIASTFVRETNSILART